MFCRKCGYENENDARFCAQCGEPLEQIIPERKMETSQKAKSSKKLAVIISVEILLIICVIAAIVVLAGKKKEKKFEQENLQQSQDTVQSEEIQEKYDLYTYVDGVLISQYGKVEPGIFETSYTMENEYVQPVEIHDAKGVITSRIQDFDYDGAVELLVVLLRNDMTNEMDSDENYNSIFMKMYEMQDAEVILSDEMEACTGVLGGLDYESDGMFLKEHDGTTYICGGYYGSTSLYADGCSYMSFVVSYQNGKFIDYTGDRIGAIGSDFSDNMEEAYEMANRLEKIDLPLAAEDVRETYMLRMTYEDEVDDILFRIEGRNVGGDSMAFYESGDVSKLGKTVLELWLHEDERMLEMTEQELSESEWKALYRDFIIQDKQSMEYTDGWEYVSYDLLYLDEDNVPELFITYQSTAAGCQLATIYENKVYGELLMSGGLNYVEKSNVFVYSYGRQGYYGDDIYSLEDGRLVTLAAGNYMATADSNGAPNFDAMEYYWNETPVTEQEYEEKISEMLSSKLEVASWEYNHAEYTYDEILEYLQ